MEVTKRIRKAAVLGLSAGAIAVAGLGLGSAAYADEPTNPCPGPTQVLGQVVVDDGTGMGSKIIGQSCVEMNSAYSPGNYPVSQYTQYQNPYYYNYNYGYNYGYPYGYSQNYWAQYVNSQYYWPYSYWAPYTTDPYVQSQMSLISNTAEVLNIPATVVVTELGQGYSLTQIAANRGWSRSAFLNALYVHIQADVNTGVYNGSISSANANTVYNQLVSQAQNLIDQPGLTSVLGSMSWQTIWQAYSY